MPEHHLAKNVYDAVADIDIDSKKVSELLDEISVATNEQSVGIDQINKAISQMDSWGKEERRKRGILARKWVLSEESMMSSIHMCDNVVKYVDETLEKWTPREKYDLIKIEKLPSTHNKNIISK
jgi:hypothetical protein